MFILFQTIFPPIFSQFSSLFFIFIIFSHIFFVFLYFFFAFVLLKFSVSLSPALFSLSFCEYLNSTSVSLFFLVYCFFVLNFCLWRSAFSPFFLSLSLLPLSPFLPIPRFLSTDGKTKTFLCSLSPSLPLPLCFSFLFIFSR